VFSADLNRRTYLANKIPVEPSVDEQGHVYGPLADED